MAPRRRLSGGGDILIAKTASLFLPIRKKAGGASAAPRGSHFFDAAINCRGDASRAAPRRLREERLSRYVRHPGGVLSGTRAYVRHNELIPPPPVRPYRPAVAQALQC